MRNDQIFVLLLILLLPMSGCFDGGGVGEAGAAQDSNSEDNSGTSTPESSSTESSTAQSRTWYSTGDVFAATWNDGTNYSSGQERCMEYGPQYDQNTGEYVGETCRRYGLPNSAADWDVSNCTSIGGTATWSNLGNYGDDDNNASTDYAYQWAPVCMDIPMLTIETEAGEALLLYQKFGAGTWTTTCNGVSTSLPPYGLPGGAYGNEYLVVQGSSMNCTHEMTRNAYFGTEIPTMNMWSVVYAIQDVTVV